MRSAWLACRTLTVHCTAREFCLLGNLGTAGKPRVGTSLLPVVQSTPHMPILTTVPGHPLRPHTMDATPKHTFVADLPFRRRPIRRFGAHRLLSYELSAGLFGFGDCSFFHTYRRDGLYAARHSGRASVSHLISGMFLSELQHQDMSVAVQCAPERLVPPKYLVAIVSLAEKAGNLPGAVAFRRTALCASVVSCRAARLSLH